MAQEASLVDILQAKGVLSKKEAQELKQGKGESGAYDQQALVNLLQEKGILTGSDLTRLQAPAPAITPSAPALTSPQVTQWLTHLESRQAELQAQVQGQAEQQAKTVVADVKKNIDWLSRFSFFGDIRVRQEGFYQNEVDARNRLRFRLRFGARLTVSDELEGGLRLVSGNPNEISANNQTMTDVFTRKPINIDQAYITIRPGKTLGLEKPFFSLTGGKFTVPFFRPRAIMGSELVFDEDLAPEGFYQDITLLEGKSTDVVRSIKLVASQWAAQENANAYDSYMLGEQLQVLFAPTEKSQLTFAAADYYFNHAGAIAQARNTNSSLVLTNSVVLRNGQIVPGGSPITPNNQNPIQRFWGGFNVLNVGAQWAIDTGYPRWPFTLMVDFAHNFQAKSGEDNAYLVGVGVGQTRNPGDWAFSAAWNRVETDSVISMFTLSDFGRNGGTNVQGPIAKIDYMLLSRLTLTAKGYFVNFVDRPNGMLNSTVNRIQFDAQFAF
jgi:hypothetical protein